MNYVKLKSRTIENNGCWDWQGSCTNEGYGHARHNGQMYLVTRLMWLLVNGPIPAGLFCCHKCDRPICCNPAHLFLGTAKDNTQDCITKGRYKSNQSPIRMRKLTAEQVNSIRASVGLQRDIALAHGVSVACVSLIRAGKRKQLTR